MNTHYPKPTVEALRLIFGEASVFHPCRNKRPTWKKWQERTALDMDKDAIRKTDLAPQTGILCGRNSDGLVCLDFDTSEALAKFRSVLQPDVRTTCVVGKPGRAKFFFRIPKDETGKKQKLRINSADVGDWLDNHSQAIVAGVHHETGEPYKIEDESSPLKTTRAQLYEWLKAAGITVKEKAKARALPCDAECSNEEEEKNTHTASVDLEIQRPTLDEIERNIETEKRTRARIVALPQDIRRLYESHVHGRWEAREGERNQFITEAVPVLIRRMNPARVRVLAAIWYEIHRELFNDTKEQHEHEVEEHIKNCLATYRQNLSEQERRIYDSRTERQQDTFRICRDLARSSSIMEAPFFILSANQLALRLDAYDGNAWRELTVLKRLEIISMIERGKRRAEGERAQATKWKWNMSSEPFTPRHE